VVKAATYLIKIVHFQRMHGYECDTGDADALLYTSGITPVVILAKTKHYFCGRRAIPEGDVQPLERKEFDPYGLKCSSSKGILHVSKLVMPARGGGERTHKTDGAVAYEVWWHQVTVHKTWSAHSAAYTVFRASSGGEEQYFTEAHFPIGAGSQVYGPRRFHREIGVLFS